MLTSNRDTDTETGTTVVVELLYIDTFSFEPISNTDRRLVFGPPVHRMMSERSAAQHWKKNCAGCYWLLLGRTALCGGTRLEHIYRAYLHGTEKNTCAVGGNTTFFAATNTTMHPMPYVIWGCCNRVQSIS